MSGILLLLFLIISLTYYYVTTSGSVTPKINALVLENALGESPSIVTKPIDDIVLTTTDELDVKKGNELVLTDKPIVSEIESISIGDEYLPHKYVYSHFLTEDVDENSFKELIGLHDKTERWFNELQGEGYVIQLATSPLDSYSNIIRNYSQYKNVINNLNFMLVLNKDDSRLTIKVLYVNRLSYRAMLNALSDLPEDIKVTNPFIENIKTLQKSANLTTLKLKAMENR